MRRAVAISLMMLFSWTLIAPLLRAQQNPETVATGRIAGVLRDPTGAVVPGAKVEVKSLASGFSKFVTTNRAGRFAFDGLPAGRYDLTVIVSGLQIVIIRNIKVIAGKETTVNVTLRFSRKEPT
jgi:hypothetical protein